MQSGVNNSLSNVHPELVSEWSDKNYPLTPDDVSYGSNKIVWWKAACGHEWEASVKSRSSGENCPICSGKRVIKGINDLKTLKPKLAKEWSRKNKLKPYMVTIGSSKKVWWKCSEGHEWQAIVKSRVYGDGCPYCSHNLVLEGFNDLASQVPKVAGEWSEKNYPLLPTQVTAYSNRKVWWECSKGHEWNALIATRSYGSECPYCSGLILLKGFNDLATTHPEIAKEWSERNESLKPDAVNYKSRKMIWWKCNTCEYEYRATINQRIKGRVCPVCADRVVLAGYNDLATTDKQLIYEWDYERNKKFQPTEISRNSMKIAYWKCPNGHSWKAKIYERTIEEKTCAVCEAGYRSVFPQLMVSYYARMKGLKALLNIEDIIGFPLETYIEKERIAIESSVGTDKFETVKARLCKTAGIKLVKVPYKETESETEYALKVKNAFQTVHIFISSDVSEDVACVRELYNKWRASL